MVTRIHRLLAQTDKLHSEYAPGFWIIAGTVSSLFDEPIDPPIQACGKGFDKHTAWKKLYGETAERVSASLYGAARPMTVSDPLSGAEHELDPASFFGPAWTSASTGCASHTMREAAEIGAITELWERRLVEQWWHHETPAARLSQADTVTLGLDKIVSQGRRATKYPRETRFLWLGEGAQLHVAAATSFSDDWTQAAIAFAADANPVRAFARAFEELLCVEFETQHNLHVGNDIHFDAPHPIARVRSLEAELKKRGNAELSDAPILDVQGLKIFPTPRTGSLAESSGVLGFPLLLADITDARISVPVCRAIFADPRAFPFLETGGLLSPL